MEKFIDLPVSSFLQYLDSGNLSGDGLVRTLIELVFQINTRSYCTVRETKCDKRLSARHIFHQWNSMNTAVTVRV